jgi:hypothetical protein
MTPDDPRPFVQSKTSQRVGVGSAVVGGIRVSYATGGRDRCGIRDRTGCGSADCAGSFVGNLTRRRHGNGIIDIATAARGEAGRTATLSSGIGHTGGDAWVGIVDDDACRTGAKRGER